MEGLKDLVNKDKPLVDSIVQAIKIAIFQQILKPGEKITEARLSEAFGISRTPLREALRILEAEGFFHSIPGRGFTVVEYSFDEILNLYIVRKSLEGTAARLAAENISTVDILALKQLLVVMKEQANSNANAEYLISSMDFHEAIAKTTKNRTLISFLDIIYTSVEIYRKANLENEERNIASYEEHFVIAEAIFNRDPERADQLAQAHVQKSLEQLIHFQYQHKSTHFSIAQ